METERRWAARMPVSLDADVFYQGIKIADCRARDVGLKGVFLQTDRGFPPQESVVDVVFHVGSGAHHVRHRIRAKVVRMAQDGIGLMFRDHDPTAFRSLQQIMQASESG